MLVRHYPEISKAAKQYDIDPAALMAVIEVESAGVLFTQIGDRQLPVIRWEGHYFDRLVKPALREKARKAGLAHPTAGKIKNPSSQLKRYEMLRRAREIDPHAAVQSISIGIGQVMGSHWDALGYKSPEAMFLRATQGFDGQLELMLRYIDRFGLMDEIQRLDWSGFARGYNGPNYRKNKYDTKLAAAYRKYSGEEAKSPASGMLRLGSKGAQVRELQRLLVRAGSTVNVDGDFGPATKEAVKTFQQLVGIEVDGVVGPQTWAALNEFRVTPDEQLGLIGVADIKEVRAGVGAMIGGGGIAATVQQAADQVNQVAGDIALIQAVGAGLTTLAAVLVVGGILWTAWGWFKSGRTFEGLS